MSQEEVREYLLRVVSHTEAEIQRRNPSYVSNCKFLINTPKRGVDPLPYCYLWLTNREVYRMVMGLNYDGTPVRKKEEDPASVPGLAAYERASLMDWGDLYTSDYEVYVPPEHGTFKFEAVVLERLGREYEEGKLFCSSPLPQNYSQARLTNLLTPYVTSGYVTVQRTKAHAYATFSNREDAYFALCMVRKVQDKEASLAFTYCNSR